MMNSSRFWVALFALVLAQGTLGTTAARIYDQKLLQNGYRMYEDGFMIQWGYSSTSGRNRTIYLPASFYDANYSIMITLRRKEDSTTNLTGDVYTLTKSSFVAFGLYHSTDSNNGAYSGGFNWFAVGRWK